MAKTNKEEILTFNYESLYKKGQKVYYLRILPTLKIKDMIQLKLRTVCPTYIIGCAKESKQAVVVGIGDKDNVFVDVDEAKAKYKNVKF